MLRKIVIIIGIYILLGFIIGAVGYLLACLGVNRTITRILCFAIGFGMGYKVSGIVLKI